MTRDDTLFAFTPAKYPGGYYPPYVNLSVQDGELILVVRSAINPDGTCGPQAKTTLPLDQARKLLTALAVHVVEATAK